MRTAAAILVLLALGCSNPTAPPATVRPAASQLRFIDFGAAEDNNHMPFALKIANEGSDALIDDIEAHVINKAIIGNVNAAGHPTEFDAGVGLFEPVRLDGSITAIPDGHEGKLVGGRTTDVWGVFEWNLPDSPQPMMAIVTATFTLRHKGREVLITPPYTFVLQSDPGVLNSVMNDQPRMAEQDAEMLELLKSRKGKPSPVVKDLIERLEALARRS